MCTSKYHYIFRLGDPEPKSSFATATGGVDPKKCLCWVAFFEILHAICTLVGTGTFPIGPSFRITTIYVYNIFLGFMYSILTYI